MPEEQQPPDLLPARMLNEFVYCPRLFYLEWVAKEWRENEFTLDGTRTHRRVDRPSISGGDEEPKARTSVTLGSAELGLIAKIDLLETDETESVPVDFKRGRRPEIEGTHAWEPERVQVCAQGLLLRANGHVSNRGVLWFADSKRRVDVEFDDALVKRTLEAKEQALEIAAKERAPSPLVDSPKCSGCSLAPVCLPDEHAFLDAGRRQSRMRRVRTRVHDRLPVHVREPGSVIRKDGDELVVEPREKEPVRVRIRDVSSLQVHGSIKLTTPALHALMRQNVPISYFTTGGWFMGRTRGSFHKNIALRQAQFRAADDRGRCLELSRRFVTAKIKNCRTMLRRNAEAPEDATQELSKLLTAVARSSSVDSLLGVEGQAAHVYFRSLSSRMVGPDKSKPFDFGRRSRRPPRDPVNAMLSYAYSLLSSTWSEVVERVGLDPHLGFFHRPRYGRPALALDLMEEFRPLLADSVVLGLVRRGEVKRKDFDSSELGCVMRPHTRKKLIAAFEGRLDDEIRHPVFGYRIQYRQVLEVQARLFAQHLLGELDVFPEFTTR